MNNWDEEKELSTDYEGRCGNCHSFLREEDKYCKYCGTKRGEGKFEPYENIILCVYGPPVKMKFHCSDCNNKWITVGLGGDESKFCPNCGSNKTNCLSQKTEEFSSKFGTICDDYEEGDIVLSEEEVNKILALRPKTREISYHLLHKVLIKNGFSECDKAEKELRMTEKEAARVNLETQIIKLKGEDPLEVYKTKNICCPSCESKLLAAIGWWGWKDDEPSFIEYQKVTGKELYYNSLKTYHNENSNNYHCLQCGCKFK